MSGIYIQIPKEFEEHFCKDRFEDSLHRLSADAHLLAGLYEQETAEMLIQAFKKAISIPDHGRLGDLDALAECIRTEGKNQAEQLADRHHPVVMAYGDCYGKCKAAPTIVPTDKEADI